MRDEGTPKPFEIAVDNLRGRGTYCINSSGRQQITFHLDNFKCDCDSASVQVFQDGVLLRTLSNLKEKANTALYFDPRGKRVLLKSSCGSQQAQKTICLDYDPPGFDGIDVFPRRNRERSVVLAARGITDDGYWLKRDYHVEVTLDGATRYRRSGTSVTLNNLSIGRHTVTIVIEDGCGRRSAPRSISFNVSDQPLTLSFITPSVNARVNRSRDLTITIQAGVPDGIMFASVYLDRVSDNEFDFTRLCYFRGTFGEGRPERKVCTVRANWSRGRHELIAVAESNSGQTSRVIRAFYVD